MKSSRAIGVPLALLVLLPLVDLAGALGPDLVWTRLFAWLGLVGVVGGVVTIVPLLLDWLALPSRSLARITGAPFLLVELTALLLVTLGLVGHLRPAEAPLVPALLTGVGAWFALLALRLLVDRPSANISIHNSYSTV